MAALLELELEDRERKIHVSSCGSRTRAPARAAGVPPGGQGGAVKLLVLVALRERSARARRPRVARGRRDAGGARCGRRGGDAARGALQLAEQCLAKYRRRTLARSRVFLGTLRSLWRAWGREAFAVAEASGRARRRRRLSPGRDALGGGAAARGLAGRRREAAARRRSFFFGAPAPSRRSPSAPDAASGRGWARVAFGRRAPRRAPRPRQQARVGRDAARMPLLVALSATSRRVRLSAASRALFRWRWAAVERRRLKSALPYMLTTALQMHRTRLAAGLAKWRRAAARSAARAQPTRRQPSARTSVIRAARARARAPAALARALAAWRARAGARAAEAARGREGRRPRACSPTPGGGARGRLAQLARRARRARAGGSRGGRLHVASSS